MQGPACANVASKYFMQWVLVIFLLASVLFLSFVLY